MSFKNVDNAQNFMNKSLNNPVDAQYYMNRISHRKSPYLIAMSYKNESDLPSNLEYTDEIGPISGSEPEYNPSLWNDDTHIKDTHNCYAYALNKISHSVRNKPQPGYFGKFTRNAFADGDYTCDTFLKRLKKDSPTLYLTTFSKPCQEGYHKAFMVITTDENNRDYHFYRQDNNGCWSHKPGRTSVTNKDASDKPISNPLTADRQYDVYNYDKPCFFFCVRPDNVQIRSSM